MSKMEGGDNQQGCRGSECTAERSSTVNYRGTTELSKAV